MFELSHRLIGIYKTANATRSTCHSPLHGTTTHANVSIRYLDRQSRSARYPCTYCCAYRCRQSLIRHTVQYSPSHVLVIPFPYPLLVHACCILYTTSHRFEFMNCSPIPVATTAREGSVLEFLQGWRPPGPPRMRKVGLPWETPGAASEAGPARRAGGRVRLERAAATPAGTPTVARED